MRYISALSVAFYAAFLVPTFIGVLFLIAVVVLAILLVRANKTVSIQNL